MLKIGITGGIGSGKTTVCRLFELLGAHIFNADLEAKKMLDNDPEVKDAVLNKFGSAIIDNTGIIDKKKLGTLVFNDKEKLEELNSIVHPAVAKHFEDWCLQQKSSNYILQEAAILFESGAFKQVEKVITVVAPLELKIKRAMQRDAVSREQVEERIKNQMSEDEKIKRSQFIIYNDEQQLLIPQVIAIHEQLMNS
ncbi:MAG: dephospho-CoA kinase [Bacteroidetes bacterium RIFCSPLOWO2_12_FULL_35_15]|nr:MAG: dephospho-CoA kinase [Bacteroidetes bacterium RIFCSPLOWO2_12_FULL_35_15]